MARDLVCGMDVVEDSAAATLEYQGKTYFFCAETCKEKFEQDPQKYIIGNEKVAPAQEDRRPEAMQDVPVKAGEKLDLPIKGISCASCVAKIEKGLSELSGVIDAKVNFATERAAITLDTNQVHVGDVIRTIQDLGYEAGSEKVTLPVQGMSCASCVEKVQKALGGVPGVIRADVNFATEKATVEYISGQVTIRDLSKAVEAAGYKILEVEEGDAVEEEKAARQAEFKKLKHKFTVGLILVIPLG